MYAIFIRAIQWGATLRKLCPHRTTRVVSKCNRLISKEKNEITELFFFYSTPLNYQNGEPDDNLQRFQISVPQTTFENVKVGVLIKQVL